MIKNVNLFFYTPISRQRLIIKAREVNVLNPILESFSKDCGLFIQEKYKVICTNELDIVKQIPHNISNYESYNEPKGEAIEKFSEMLYWNISDECDELQIINVNRHFTEIYHDLSHNGLNELAKVEVGVVHHVTYDGL